MSSKEIPKEYRFGLIKIWMRTTKIIFMQQQSNFWNIICIDLFIFKNIKIYFVFV